MELKLKQGELAVSTKCYLKLQMHLRCSWAGRRGGTAACTDTPRRALNGAWEHCWGQQRAAGLGTTPEAKENWAV